MHGKAAHEAPKHGQGVFCVLSIHPTFGENRFDEVAKVFMNRMPLGASSCGCSRCGSPLGGTLQRISSHFCCNGLQGVESRFALSCCLQSNEQIAKALDSEESSQFRNRTALVGGEKFYVRGEICCKQPIPGCRQDFIDVEAMFTVHRSSPRSAERPVASVDMRPRSRRRACSIFCIAGRPAFEMT